MFVFVTVALIASLLPLSVIGQSVCEHVTSGTVPFPAFKLDNYLVNIEVNNAESNNTYQVVELESQLKNKRAVKVEKIALSKAVSPYQTITELTTNGTIYINGSDCSYFAKNDTPVYVNPFDLDKVTIGNASGLRELLELASKSTFSLELMNMTTLHGLAVKCFAGCSNITLDKNVTTREIQVCYANTSVPIQVEIYSSDNANKSILKRVYTLSDFVTSLSEDKYEDMLLPPPGVHCAKPNKTGDKPLPALGDRFQLSIEYVNPQNKIIDNTFIAYDGQNRLISFTYSNLSEFDESFTTGLNISSYRGKVRVVQDFATGLQYLTDRIDHTCIGVDKIPLNAGTSEESVDGSGRAIKMKNSSYLFVPANISGPGNWSYVGQRMFEHIMADVWTAETVENITHPSQIVLQQKTVYEVYYATSNWTDADAGNSSVPLVVNIYKRNNESGNVTATYQHFQDYSPFASFNWAQKEFQIASCLNASNNSFLVVEINETMSNINKFGREAFEYEFLKTISVQANVRLLRLQSLFMIPSSTLNSSLVLFTILDMVGISGQVVVNRTQESSTLDAINKLNETLTRDSIVFLALNFRGNKTTIKIFSTTLRTTQYYFSGNHSETIVVVQKEGYTGSSMAGIGFSMLFIGIIAGVGGAWWLWKRNRGVAYQVYE